MASDVLTSGIEPGGLTTSYEIKALVCYLFRSLNSPLTSDEVNNILQEDGLANYFEVSSAISDLERLGHLGLSEDTKTLFLTNSGKEMAKDFERAIPYTVREKAARAGVKFLAKKKRDTYNKATVERNGDAYILNVQMKLNENADLLSLKLTLGDYAQAEEMKKQFLSDPELFYKGVLSLLIGDMKAVGGLFPSENAKYYKD